MEKLIIQYKNNPFAVQWIIKNFLKKLYEVKRYEELNYCKNCSSPCINLYCDSCQYQLENDPNYFD